MCTAQPTTWIFKDRAVRNSGMLSSGLCVQPNQLPDYSQGVWGHCSILQCEVLQHLERM